MFANSDEQASPRKSTRVCKQPTTNLKHLNAPRESPVKFHEQSANFQSPGGWRNQRALGLPVDPQHRPCEAGAPDLLIYLQLHLSPSTTRARAHSKELFGIPCWIREWHWHMIRAMKTVQV